MSLLANGPAAGLNPPAELAPGGLPAGIARWLPPGLVNKFGPGGLNHELARKRFHPHRLWVDQGVARRPRLLFLGAESLSQVNIYTMPDLKLSGEIGGFIFPWGECSDNSGNIWVADLSANVD